MSRWIVVFTVSLVIGCSGDNPGPTLQTYPELPPDAGAPPADAALDSGATPDLFAADDGAELPSVPCDPELCNDDDPCTTDICDPELGCVFQANDDPCDDGDPCTTGDLCAFGGCAGVADECDDGDPCTAGECDPVEGCQYVTLPSCVASCGNDVCEDGEGCASCTEDCGLCLAPKACCAASDPPGCANNADLEACVCALAPDCCTGSWAAECVALVTSDCNHLCDYDPGCGDTYCEADQGENCDSCPKDCGACGGDSDCCDLHADGSCADVVVEACVCTERPECCDGPWDAACVALAAHACGAACKTCGDLTCAPNETCLTCPDDCGTCAVASNCCDTLDSSGCADPVCEATVCAIDPYCCLVAWDFHCKALALESCDGCSADGSVCGDDVCDGTETCTSCPPDCGPCAVGPCCEVTPEPGCPTGPCQGQVCAIDAYCCATAWDEQCVALAASYCGCGLEAGCGNGTCDKPTESCLSCVADCGACGGTSDCCLAHDAPGCDHLACQEAICGGDAACCDTEWSATCANAALAGCAACEDFVDVCGNGVCGPDEGCGDCESDCGECPPDPVCGDGECNGSETCLLCEKDCGECPPVEHCCQELTGKGCPVDDECNDVVCGIDPYCCNSKWDGACGKCASGGPGYQGLDCTAALDVCECL